jgi:hypothetical protein
VFFAMFAGAGVRGGQVLGTSDEIAAYPASFPVYPSQVGATIFDALGIAADSLMQDRLNRPFRISEGEPISPLYTGSVT